MKKILFCIFLNSLVNVVMAQNEQDVLRYAQLSANGTARFNAMGGAFGALGADITCGAYNPAGLAIFRKGEISFSGAWFQNSARATFNNRSSSFLNSDVSFKNAGLVCPWLSRNDKDGRNVFAISVNQLANFDNTLKLSGYTNNASIAKDMLNVATSLNSTRLLNSFYEGLAFDTYLLDTVKNRFFSNLDTKRAVLQSRSVVTSGRINEVNISLGHSFKENFYFGISLGLPQLTYVSTTKHTEQDDKDSMRVTITSPSSYTTTYIDGLPVVDRRFVGFNSLTFTEYFKTTGSGINLKLGFVGRINDSWRIGAYYHTATYYTLTDNYYNQLSVAFDNNKSNPNEKKVPANGANYSYSMVTPSRLGVSLGYVYKKVLAVGLDYETLSFKNGLLQGENESDFATVNTRIKNSFQRGHNLRFGVELNTQPLMYRLGYSMTGSNNGALFAGSGVRNIISGGVGYRTKRNVFFDLTWQGSYSKFNYSVLRTITSMAKVKAASYLLLATIGVKF